jgi:hypothetical protein
MLPLQSLAYLQLNVPIRTVLQMFLSHDMPKTTTSFMLIE